MENAARLGLFVCFIYVLNAPLQAQQQGEVSPGDQLERNDFLDVTKTPYFADPTGHTDATTTIQRAVNDARDHGVACYFPSGTYLISDTISCQQKVTKLNQPRSTDGRTQHYWNQPNRIVLLGSTKGERPILKLSEKAKGFDDPQNPKLAVWVWAQTRDDAPGKMEPMWGKEQPNISFSHVFKGIDIDVRGHSGAIGIRHSGSQGSTLQDVTVHAEGAYAGLSNCCGQGGGTYNIEVIGGRYGITIDRGSRFPLLVACNFRNQTDASVRFADRNQMPTLLVGCCLKTTSDRAIDMTKRSGGAGISLVDCVVEVETGGSVCATRQAENIFLEDVWVSKANAVFKTGKSLPNERPWIRIKRYSSSLADAVRLVNGMKGSGEMLDCALGPGVPDIEQIRDRHIATYPSFEDSDCVNVKDFGAKGDGVTNDRIAFENAIVQSKKVFVPPGKYQLTGTLQLRTDTQLFGVAGGITSIGDHAIQERSNRVSNAGAFMIVTADNPDASPLIAFLSIRGQIAWNSGKGTCMLAPAKMRVSKNGGGRIYGAMARGGPMIISGTAQPLSFYALNVERVGHDPQSTFDGCTHIRIYFFKVEAGTVNRAEHPDANTTCRIIRCSDVRVYCMNGVVRHMKDRPMIEVIDSDDIQISQLQTFSPGDFAHLMETRGEHRFTLPSSKMCSLFIRGNEHVEPAVPVAP
ncbi:Pectate lyase superfamily protein [Planctomycetes bacterium CA13]|uniref:Pectate lyase superfamily protein n=1 Tax=Novipirellula herctigrandis TaxID=2527986 RepID=A0A5C5YWN2_9BACT|nr:Pectate lyase superfamily protein [Planctomycetes bacterium CA13]